MAHHRAFLKVQDGCDACCTYCIIPRLRPRLWSRPIDDVVAEARQLAAAGHAEIVLTGIFLGAYGQPTALRRRQREGKPLAQLLEALCTRVEGLERIRLSSMEPGDLDEELLAVMRGHRQLVPHFHLPLQSGSDRLLHRMNRQYTSDDYLRMIDRVHGAYDRPAVTSDVIVGFPGENDEAFDQTMRIVERVRFIHVHAFAFSPRPGTAAARWMKDFVPGRLVNARRRLLEERAGEFDLAYRRQFVGQSVGVLVESETAGIQHGRSERYFMVHFEHPRNLGGRCVDVRVEKVTPGRTVGSV